MSLYPSFARPRSLQQAADLLSTVEQVGKDGVTLLHGGQGLPIERQ